MARAKGNVFSARGRWYVRVRLGEGKRQAYQLPTCSSEPEAFERGAVLAAIADSLRSAGLADRAPAYLERAAAAPNAKALAVIRRAVEILLERGSASASGLTGDVSFEAFAERWTSGELARTYPDHVKAKRSADRDVQILKQHINPVVGAIPLEAFTLDHALRVMQSLPSDLEASTRRQIAKCMARVLSLAHWPARLIPANPIPRGFSPKIGPEKALQWLYPDEDAKLLACAAVPLFRRVFFGFQAREGTRPTEGRMLTWGDLDLDRGVVRLDVNKTDDPRMWALNPGVVRALRAWRRIRERELGRPIEGGEFVFTGMSGEPMDRPNLARTFRDHLQAAGVKRAALFERTSTRRAVRVHDLRATFITLALAHGKTEAWVADRTGHKSSKEINRYRRAARTAAELGMPELASLDGAIPEFREPAPGGSAAGATSLGPGNGMGNAHGDSPADDASKHAISKTFSHQAPHLRRPRDAISLVWRGGRGASPEGDSRGDFDVGGDPVRPPTTGVAQVLAKRALSPDVRTGVVASLAAHIAELAAAADVDGARVLNDAMTRLLTGPRRPASLRRLK